MVLSMAFLFSISLVFGQTKEKVKVLIEAEQKIEEEIKETKKRPQRRGERAESGEERDENARRI